MPAAMCQPLTRRWRLVQAAQPFSASGLGLSLHRANLGLGQIFDTLPEALATMQRMTHWKIADASMLEPEHAYQVQFQFRLDVSQLPRLLQIGTVGHSDWALQLRQSVEVLPLAGDATQDRRDAQDMAQDLTPP